MSEALYAKFEQNHARRSSEFILVTPKIARQLLKMNRINRPVIGANLRKFIRVLRNGEWKVTHQGVGFTVSMRMIDGQHRLLAIIETGIPAEMQVTYGLPEDCQIAVDDHARRSDSDTLTIETGEVVHRKNVAVINAIYRHTPGLKEKPSKAELVEIYPKFAGPRDFYESLNKTKIEKGVTAGPVIGAIYLAWFYVPDLDDLARFHSLLLGAEWPSEQRDKTVLLLRDWLLKNGAGTVDVAKEAFYKTQKAIRLFVDDKAAKQLRAGLEPEYLWPLKNSLRPESNPKPHMPEHIYNSHIEAT